ncbi:MAG: hypothetical protein ACLGPL_09030 [Acidobacteriota bacterium]
MKMCESVRDIPSELNGSQKERAAEANRTYCKVCEESGMQTCSWRSLDAWQEFVDGKIGQYQLQEKARNDLRHLGGLSATVEVEIITDESLRKNRAKLANRMYRKVCEEAGLGSCFFANFGTWSDYVQGRIGESEFIEGAKLEAQKLIEAAKAEKPKG